MNAVILIGIQGSGKSTFYRERFADTHVRVNLDMLRTRHREERLIETCLQIAQPLVIDNTNVTREERARYLSRLREGGVPITGYYFQGSIQACKARNESRPAERQAPLRGLLGTHARLELPRLDEGFGELFYVRIEGDSFIVEGWRDEV